MSNRGGDKVPDVVRIPPYHYIHVLDQNSNVSRLESGPQVFVRKDNEKIMTTVMKYVTIPPRHYCTIRNPVVKDGVSSTIYYRTRKAYGNLYGRNTVTYRRNLHTVRENKIQNYKVFPNFFFIF
jgi:hypothetical protein